MRSRLKEVATSAILEAAEEVFAEVGLDARMEAIAARAGVAVGTLYNHFSDRETLLAALIATRRAKVLEQIQGAANESRELPFREHLIHVVRTVCDVKESQGRFRRRLMESNLPGSDARKRQTSEFFVQILQPSFERARAAGVLRADPHHLQLPLFFGLLHALITMGLEDPNHAPVSQLAQLAVDSFLNGVAA